MMKFSLENREFSVNRQTIHMDQGITYAPEYIESRRIIDYPSRRAQIVRAVWKGQLQADEQIAKGTFRPMLTGQGERWQNFYEDDACDEYADVIVLGREMLLKQGFMPQVTEKIQAAMKANQGHILNVPAFEASWSKEDLIDAASSRVLLVDDATAVYAADKADGFLTVLAEKGEKFASLECTYLGYEHFAHGMVDQAKVILEKALENLKGKEVLVTSGQSLYMLTKVAEKLELQPAKAMLIWQAFAPYEDLAEVYVYGGSFNLRFLQLPLAEWFPADEEAEKKDTPEFFKLLVGQDRINVLNRWQPPIAAEFEVFGLEKEEKDAIFASGCAQVKKAEAKELVALDPTAYKKAKEEGLAQDVKWIGELV